VGSLTIGQVIAHDFVPVKPHKTTMVELGIGQRADVVVEATGKHGESYWIRSDVQVGCSLSAQPLARAAVYYPDADTGNPNSTENADIYPDCTDSQFPLNISEPVFPMTPATVPEKIIDATVNFTVNATGFFLFTMNDSSFRVNYNEPPLLLANKGNVSFPKDWNVENTGNAKTVRIVLYNPTPASHPMHIHGNTPNALLDRLRKRLMCVSRT
jgi:FtsP/CotA-like multicopper oxidase with cupredoxin domain